MPFKKRSQTRSPIRGKALREPGQSLSEELQELINDRLFLWFLLPLLLSVMAGLEWWRWYQDTPYNPLFYTAVAVFAILVSTLRLFPLIRQIRALKRGRDGERVVGQFLDGMRSDSCHVLHDVLGEGFNVDHIIVSVRGIYTVETKTISLPADRTGKICCDGAQLLLDGRSPDRDPIGQAKAQAAWLKRILKESTGRDYAIQPVVAFPGWFVEPTCKRVAGVWIVEPKALAKFIDHEPISLKPEQVHLAAFHLRTFIRATTAAH